MPSKADKIAEYAEKIADDDIHGYSQYHRTGTPDFDCSSLAIACMDYAGFPVSDLGASYTGNMISPCIKAGFSILPYSPGLPLKRGDVLLNTLHHAAIYIGNGYIVEACSDENGGISGNTPGDQTGHEIHRRTFYSYPWEYVIRAPDENAPVTDPVSNDPDCSYTERNAIQITAPQIRYKDYGSAVAAAQGALNYHGFGKLEVNGFFSSTMREAVKRFQSVHELEVDGIIGTHTWYELMYWG